MAGVVPVIRVLQESLAGARIERVHGIVNGTTNYILTEMAAERHHLRRGAAARRRRSATPRPTRPTTSPASDAAAKMAILARLAFSTPVHLDQVRYEGIEQITRRRHGLRARARPRAEADRHRGARSAAASTCACTPPSSTPSTRSRSVHGPFNAVTVESDAITEITLSGPGAGGPQTASAVLGDVISAMIPPATTPETTERAAVRRRRRVGVLPAPRGRRPPRRARPDRRDPRHAGRVGEVGRPAGPGRQRAARDGAAPAARVAPLRARCG